MMPKRPIINCRRAVSLPVKQLIARGGFNCLVSNLYTPYIYILSQTCLSWHPISLRPIWNNSYFQTHLSLVAITGTCLAPATQLTTKLLPYTCMKLIYTSAADSIVRLLKIKILLTNIHTLFNTHSTLLCFVTEVVSLLPRRTTLVLLV